MTSIEKRFGERIRQLRKEQGWSQEELAYRSRLHRTYISSLEGGRRNVSLKALEQLADAFSISLKLLMDI